MTASQGTTTLTQVPMQTQNNNHRKRLLCPRCREQLRRGVISKAIIFFCNNQDCDAYLVLQVPIDVAVKYEDDLAYDITGPLRVLEGEMLSLFLISVTDQDIEEMREIWDEYSTRPGLFDAELEEDTEE